MKIKFKKILMIILSFIMLFTSIPLGGLSAEAAYSAPTSGVCGKNAKWSYNANTKTLTISGKGAMYDYGDIGSPQYSEDITWTVNKIDIKEGITKIGNWAFADLGNHGYYSDKVSIVIPKTVKSIGHYAFSNVNTASLTIANGVEKIGAYAFGHSNSIKKVVIPHSVKVIDDGAFYEFDRVEEITLGNGLVKVGEDVFNGRNLKKLVVGKNLGESVVNVLSGFNTIGTVSISAENPYISRDKSNAIYNRNKTKLLFVPNIKGVASYTVAKSVEEIGEGAFNYNPYIKTLTMTGVKKINNDAVFCPNLTKLNLGTKIEMIGNGAFADSEKLSSVTIPASVQRMANWSFNENTFIKIDENNKYFSSDNNGAFFNKNKTTLYSYPNSSKAATYTVPQTVKKIRAFAFAGNEKLENVILPSNLEIIEGYAFSDCEKLKEITIPKNVKSIGEYAFEDCGMKSLTIEEGSTVKIGSGAFYSCEDLLNIKVPDTVYDMGESAFADTALYNKGEGDCLYVGKVLSEVYENGKSTIKIKDGTKAIADGAFYYGVKNITIPESVSYIAEDAFGYIDDLYSITLDSKNKDFVLENGVLYNKDKTRLIAITRKSNLKEYTFPSTVKSYDSSAFYFAPSIQKITFNNKLEKIDLEDFISTKWYKSLPEDKPVYVGKYLIGIKDEAENGGFTAPLTVKDGTEKVNVNYYYGSFIVPTSVKEISGYFDSIYYKGTKEQWKSVDKIVMNTEKIRYGFNPKNHTHEYSYYDKEASTCSNKAQRVYVCPCGKTYTENVIIAAHFTSDSVVYSATATRDGKLAVVCMKCSKILKMVTIPKIASITVSPMKFVYDGRAKEPKAVVKDRTGRVIEEYDFYLDSDDDYAKNIGTYKMHLESSYYYDIDKSYTFTIVPGKVEGVKLATSSSAVSLKWNAVAGAGGYAIYMKEGTGKYTKIGTSATTSFKKTGLKKDATYTFLIKAYKKADGKYYYGDYSTAKSIKVK